MNSLTTCAIAKEFPLELEYRKPTGITAQDVARLREWLRTQPHLPEEYITDLDLILIYHCCNNSTEVSKRVLDLNFTLRTLFTGFYKDRYFDSKIENILTTVLLKPLPERSKEGYACIYARLLDPNPKKYVFLDAVRAFLMVLDLWQYEEGTWPGLIIVIDMDGATMSHITALDLQTLQQYFCFIQEALLVKLKSLHYLNAPSFMDKFMQLIKPFIKANLINALHFHTTGSRTLDEFYPIAGLPEGAGGKYKNFVDCRDEVLEKVKANEEYFKNENKKRVVESLRPGKPKTVSDIFGGVLGSFKKLDID